MKVFAEWRKHHQYLKAKKAVEKRGWLDKITPRVFKWMRRSGALCLILFLSSCQGSPAPAMANITPLMIAQSEIGHGEIGSNNKGVYVRQYLNGKEGLPWCAGFISYCLKKAQIKAPYTLRARDFMKIGKPVTNPQAGDLIIFSRKGGGGHVEIMEKVTKDKIITIAGNTGNFPSVVKRVTYKRGYIKNLLGFWRVK